MIEINRWYQQDIRSRHAASVQGGHDLERDRAASRRGQAIASGLRPEGDIGPIPFRRGLLVGFRLFEFYVSFRLLRK